jgi:heme exporter protein D
MIWSSFAEFGAMGGYGVFVWGSVGVSAALLALEVWQARLGRRQALDTVGEAMDAEGDEAFAPHSPGDSPPHKERSGVAP